MEGIAVFVLALAEPLWLNPILGRSLWTLMKEETLSEMGSKGWQTLETRTGEPAGAPCLS
jgi:hypothetical protein